LFVVFKRLGYILICVLFVCCEHFTVDEIWYHMSTVLGIGLGLTILLNGEEEF